MTEMTDQEARRFDQAMRAAESRPPEPRRRITPGEFEQRSGTKLHNSLRKYSMDALNPSISKLDFTAIEAAFGRILDDIDAVHELCFPAGTGPSLSSAQRDNSLIAGILEIAKTLRGGWAFGGGMHGDFHETLLDRLLTVSADAEFWRGQSPGLLANMLASHRYVTEALEAQGILAWACPNKGTRVVNLNWLTDPADISAFVKSEPERGRRCRFCTAVEPDDSRELESFEQPNKAPTVHTAGFPHRRRVILYGQIHVHSRCRDHWQRWVSIAENYNPTPEAA